MIGIDLGDKSSRYCELKEDGELAREGAVPTTKKGLAQQFARRARTRIALEVGPHSPWVDRLLREWGHEVIVANARQLRLISQSTRKDDRTDAETLARLARADPRLLRPIQHRSEKAQRDLTSIRVRAVLVESRTGLVNSARGMAKAAGHRLPACDADRLGVAHLAELPPAWQATLRPLLEAVESLTKQIHALDRQLAELAQSDYPETQLLRPVPGVGPLISLTYVLTLEDPARFAKSRDAGCYVGLRPKRSQSGARQPELGITKEGDRYLRTLLVQGAHCLLRGAGPDNDLRRWGFQLAARGGKNARKRAIVAVARKLAVLLHRLWVSREAYEPLRNATSKQHLASAA